MATYREFVTGLFRYVPLCLGTVLSINVLQIQ